MKDEEKCTKTHRIATQEEMETLKQIEKDEELYEFRKIKPYVRTIAAFILYVQWSGRPVIPNSEYETLFEEAYETSDKFLDTLENDLETALKGSPE